MSKVRNVTSILGLSEPRPVKPAVPSLRELEELMAAAGKPPLLTRVARNLGIQKEPEICRGFTRQALPCRRPVLKDGFCRLHSESPNGKKFLWGRVDRSAS